MEAILVGRIEAEEHKDISADALVYIFGDKGCALLVFNLQQQVADLGEQS